MQRLKCKVCNNRRCNYVSPKDKKYKLIKKRNSKYYRIKALIDIIHYGVKEGDLGGLVESEHNLSHTGSCWIEEHGIVDEQARVEQDVLVVNDWISGSSIITGRRILWDLT